MEKVCIVTGANSGIGKVTALELAKQGNSVVMVCRNRQKGEAVLSEIMSKTNNLKVELLIADLSSMKEIRRLAANINTQYPVIDVLINNAGAINGNRTETVDGYETTFATNHLSYFLLTLLLLDHLKAAPKARIVNVASQAQQTGKLHFEDLNLKNGYSSFKAYSQSKLANIMFTYELARRLEKTNITVNCVHPGGVATNFGSGLEGFWKSLIKLAKPLLRTPEKGAETVIWLATSPEAENITGRYFADKKQIRSIPLSYDQDKTKQLWEKSEKMTGLA